MKEKSVIYTAVVRSGETSVSEAWKFTNRLPVHVEVRVSTLSTVEQALAEKIESLERENEELRLGREDTS